MQLGQISASATVVTGLVLTMLSGKGSITVDGGHTCTRSLPEGRSRGRVYNLCLGASNNTTQYGVAWRGVAAWCMVHGAPCCPVVLDVSEAVGGDRVV